MIRAIGQKVIVKPRDRETETAGGIIIPDTAEQRLDSGVVVSIGRDVDPHEVEVGLEVFYRYFAGTELEHAGETYLVLDDEEILADAI